MRTHHCLTLFMCGAFLLGSLKADAQTPGAGTATFNSHAPIDPSSIPAGFNPYPTISPFEHAFQTTYNDRGTWLSETSREMRTRSYFSLEAIVARFKGPGDAQIGENNVVTPFFDPGDQAIDNGDLGRSTLGELGPLQEFNNGQGPFPNFQSGLIDGSHGTGIRGTFGVERADGIGLEFSGMWIGPQWESTSKGFPIQRFGASVATEPFASDISYESDGTPGSIDSYPTFPSGPDSSFRLGLDVVDLDSITVTNPGIGLNDGSVLGTIQRFDLYMRTAMRSELYGAHISLIQTPTRQVGPFEVRPVFGARYLNPVEHFSVEGHDSGLDYVVDPAGDVAIIGGIEDFEDPVTPAYRAYIESRSETHLGGAELGWKYTAGGDHFRLDGETKFGVMGAAETLRIWTKGIGQPFLFNEADEPAGNFNLFYDPELETIDSHKSSFVTPTFQQSFNTTSRPFAYVPVLKKIGMFREANLKAGWTFLLIGQLQRPNQQINYDSGNGAIPPITGEPILAPVGDPSLKPNIKKDRSLYFVNYFNFGLEWEY